MSASISHDGASHAGAQDCSHHANSMEEGKTSTLTNCCWTGKIAQSQGKNGRESQTSEMRKMECHSTDQPRR
jgi:hypothetical protein